MGRENQKDVSVDVSVRSLLLTLKTEDEALSQGLWEAQNLGKSRERILSPASGRSQPCLLIL